MKVDTKFDFNQRVYAENRDRVVSGVVKSVNCKCDRFGTSVSYDVLIDRDEKVTYDYWMTLDEKYFFATMEEAKAELAAVQKLNDGRGKN